MSTLIVKLGSALLKQVSKPVANQLSAFVMRSPTLRTPVVSTARVVHKYNVWIRTYGEKKKLIIGEMTDDKAVELATTMFTEAFIYSVAAGTIYWEYQRSVTSANEKKEAEKEFTRQLRAEAAAQRQLLLTQNEEQYTALREMDQRITALEDRLQRKSFWR